jgi:beta-glucosidase
VGYRHFDKNNIAPQFAFGHGLSYTTFDYSNIKVSRSRIKPGESLTVELQVKNTGRREGAEVVQLYLQDIKASVPRPVKELKGFEKVLLRPGQMKLVRLSLEARSMAFYDVTKKQWTVEPGQFKVMAGSSSRDIRVSAEFEVVSS